LNETFPVGHQYHVSCRVELNGVLTLPPEKQGAVSRELKVTGNSAIEYDERVLHAGADSQVDKTFRVYRRIDFQRQVGDQSQESTIRPAVRRLVVLRHNNLEVPFSPDGPLTSAEMDLVRTDVFTPALNGLLGGKAVAPGDRWPADRLAIQELTDLERIDEGQVECRFDEVTALTGRKLARISFTGSVKGLNEDGPNRQQLDGYLFFDLEARQITYLSLNGVSLLLGPDGQPRGRVEGRFVLTKKAPVQVAELSDAGLRGVGLEPDDDNTLFLYEAPALGIRFVYPRRWHVAGVRGQQISLDEPGGNGILITCEPSGRMPTAEQFLAESRDYLTKQKATILRNGQPRRLAAEPRGLEQFALEVEMGGRREFLDYYVISQPAGGATLAARLTLADLDKLRRQVVRIAQSVQLQKPGDGR
jgi:hypothetical protein